MHCGHNHGYWSWANELWYRTRRDAILSGRATVLTGAQWASELKGDKRWWVGRRKLEEIAASSIERQVRTGRPPISLRAEAHIYPSVLLPYNVGYRA